MTYGLCLSFLSAAGPWDSTPKTDLDQEDVQQVMFLEWIRPRVMYSRMNDHCDALPWQGPNSQSPSTKQSTVQDAPPGL